MKTILIIEDNEQNLYLARYILEQRGFRVEAAVDGPTGIAAALRLLPALILLDMQLPGMDGREVAVRLQAQPSLKPIPIVAVTSYAMAGDREHILKAGCTGYIEKPINPETFIGEIETFMQAATGRPVGPRVLVVDDIESNRYLLESLFLAHGYQVAQAAQVRDALAAARRQPPDVVITDILMPVMDGFTLCQEWRGDPQLREIPFVFYTATYTSPEDEQLAMKMGADLFLIKPAEPEVLVRKLREVLTAQHGHRLPPEVSASFEPHAHLREYNAALVRKPEDKMQQLDQLNRSLEQRVLERTVELEAANRQLQALSHVGTWTAEINPVGQLTWSAEAHRIFGLSPECFDGRTETWFNLVHPDDLEAFRAANREAWAGTRPLDIEHRIVRSKGQVRWVHEQAEVDRDARGRPIRLTGIVRDVTAQRLLEEQLRQAQKMEAVGQLAGGVAHDFNNLLTVIQGHAGLLLGAEGLLPDARESAQQIAESAERAANLTRQLLAFSRRQVIQTKPLDLNQVVTGMMKMLGRILGEQVVLRELLTSDLPAIQADVGMIEQVILNLAINARDAMPQGGVVTLKTSLVVLEGAAPARSPKAVPGRYIRLAVTDTGSGIRAEHLVHIFEPFFTTKGVGKGTGLGLAMVYGVVEQHGGWINVDTQLGSGTTFEIFFPISAEVAVPIRPVNHSAPVGGRESLLVVEDGVSLRRLVSGILRAQGYQVLEAANGIEALRVWRGAERGVDLMLVDLVLPGGLSGGELAQQLRRESPGLKVIFTSGYGPEQVTQSSSLIPGAASLPKPYLPNALVQLVRECLDTPAASGYSACVTAGAVRGARVGAPVFAPGGVRFE